MQKHILFLTSLWFFTSTSLAQSKLTKTEVVEDSEKNVSQLITSFGYPVQEFTVTTEDSYDIMIQRIPHGRVQTPPPFGGRPIAFLMTGVLSSSADFVVNMPDQSLGFILADHGFDVWLGNVRGTIYSKHVSLKKSQRKFWDFSFDEMIKYDLPAQIDTVLHETKKNSLLYVGWSQGTIIMFGLLATKPHYNDKVRLFNAMGPAPYLGNMQADVTRMLPFSGLLKAVFDMTVGGAFMAKTTIISKKLAKGVCRSDRQGPACKSVFKLVNGGFPIEMNVTRLPVYMANDPAGTSVRNILHIGQLVKSKRFQRYDWGPLKNKKMYGQREPPEYDLRKVTAPVALYWSDGDVLTCTKDVRLLEMILPNVVLSYKVPVPGFTHIDFAWSIKAKDHLYKAILQMMIKYSRIKPRVSHYSPWPQGGYY